MTTRVRSLVLPLIALVLVAGVLGVQVANGGGAYEPLQPADACSEQVVTSQAEGIEGLTEQLVLLAVADAACALGVTREALTLELARSGAVTDAQVDALREGLRSAVAQLESDGALPLVSELVDEVLDSTDLNSVLDFAIRALPDSLVDGALKTDDVLLRAIDDLDLRALLSNLDDQGDLNRQVEAAVTQAVKDSLLDRVRDII